MRVVLTGMESSRLHSGFVWAFTMKPFAGFGRQSQLKMFQITLELEQA